MEDQSKTELTGHEYDGIQEYDNPLPNWWLVTFFATIIFGFIYYIHYTFGGGLTQAQELEIEMQALPKAIVSQWNETDLTEKMSAAGALEQGRLLFAAKCAVCHGPEGQGLIGPNLVDAFWIHGKGSRVDLMKVISEGVVEKGMPAWATLISDQDVVDIAAFVYSVRGSHPANPKAPQGQEARD